MKSVTTLIAATVLVSATQSTIAARITQQWSVTDTAIVNCPVDNSHGYGPTHSTLAVWAVTAEAEATTTSA